MKLWLNRKTGQAVVSADQDRVAREVISKAPHPEDFEELNVSNVVYFKAIGEGHLSVTTVPDDTI
jgi:hypothetical protein